MEDRMNATVGRKLQAIRDFAQPFLHREWAIVALSKLRICCFRSRNLTVWSELDQNPIPNIELLRSSSSIRGLFHLLLCLKQFSTKQLQNLVPLAKHLIHFFD